VQLPNFDGPGRDWPAVREAMLKTLKLPNTGMAITIDIGETKNIHPLNKQAVGQRLGMWALGTIYGQKTAVSGPLPESSEVRGSEILVKFKHADGGLTAKDGELKGFTIAGSNQQFVPARARIEGNSVIVSCPEVKQPAAVRYAWENNPVCNLFNGSGLPASPFRTDDWSLEPK
jgi:sialate O-acetylesterase